MATVGVKALNIHADIKIVLDWRWSFEPIYWLL